MPLYDYECLVCENQWEAFNTIANRHDEVCECGTVAKMNISATRTKPQILGYFSENLNAHITGPAQRHRIMREKGMEER